MWALTSHRAPAELEQAESEGTDPTIESYCVFQLIITLYFGVPVLTCLYISSHQEHKRFCIPPIGEAYRGKFIGGAYAGKSIEGVYKESI